MSQILTIAATISRAELALADLSIEADGVYRVTRLAPGGRSWSRQTASSRYVHGESRVHAVLAASSVAMDVRIYASTAVLLEQRVVELVNAVSQSAYRLTATINSVAHAWDCEEADVDVVNGEFDKFALAQHQQEYRLLIPKHPVAVAGAL